VALTRPGRWRITVGFGPLRAPFARDVLVRRRARQRILVTGDSMILGLFEALGRKLGDRAAVQGDPHPGRGITTPGHFDWTGHARRSARAARPDVTVVFVGAADAGYPLRTLSGATVSCCEPAWVAAYARRVRRMMRSYARAGTGLVYWVLLPAPRSAAKARVFGAENSGVRRAAHGEESGVKVVDRIATVLTPHGRFGDRIVLAGRPQVVRDADGLHLSPAGIDIAADILLDALRTDGLAA
jgi:hypothetical protein